MNLNALRVVTNKLARPTLKLQKASPTVLFGVGVIGVVATVVLASRATLKLEEVLEKAQTDIDTAKSIKSEEYSEQDRTKDIALVYAKTGIALAKMYGPAVLVGAVSISALTGSHVVLTRRNAGLTAAYAALDRGFRAYRERVVKELGPEKDDEFRFGIEEREISEETPQGTIVSKSKGLSLDGKHSIYAKIFDESNRNWQKAPGYNQLFIQCQQNYANDLLKARGHVLLNDVYDMLGFDRTPEGCVVGWVLDSGASDNFVDFGVFQGDRWSAQRFVNGDERSVILDFNVDGVVYNLL